jgi:xanthine dehydrogenase accessory factor
MSDRASELADARVAFVRATVVRAQHPTSAVPGDDAVVLADGTIEGFVGGQCAEESVRSAALDVLESGEALLLRVLPSGEKEFPDLPGAVVAVNACLSGGALEIFLEPVIPSPLLHVVGATPIADAVGRIAEAVGFAISRPPGAAGPAGAVAVVIASLGHDEEESIRAALAAGVAFVGLVASGRRGSSLLDSLGLSKEQRSLVHTPVGIEIGARTPEEIALSILAEVVRSIRVDGLSAPRFDALSEPARAVDPVCGMTVVQGSSAARLEEGNETQWFCSTACRDRFAERLAR